MVCGVFNNESSLLKTDLMGLWIEREWMPKRADQEWFTLLNSESCLNAQVLGKLGVNFSLPGGYRFAGSAPTVCPDFPQINQYEDEGDVTQRVGAFVYRFAAEGSDVIEVLVMGAFYSNYQEISCVVCLPKDFMPAWVAFSNECDRLDYTLEPSDEVVIIGGNSQSFVPTVNWEDIVLPATLKTEIFEDVRAFFTKGVNVYNRLKLKPFRKLLLAGVPGTGKTMLCSALAKWALDEHYLVIYISSARRESREPLFGRIEEALMIASKSSLPTLILIEEFDAYLRDEEKALVLNVLDGAEGLANQRGTLMVATTNYPEAIDERILKRPGRLDRIFVIPEVRDVATASSMLRLYLGEMWREEHVGLVPQLVGFPGAFIREVSIYALTQMANDDLQELSLDVLQRSFAGLKEQLDARDDFLLDSSSKSVFAIGFLQGRSDQGGQLS